jgi:hypothetical protein
MRKHCTGATGEDRRHPSSLLAEQAVPKRKNALIDGNKTSVVEAPLDQTRIHAKRNDLPTGDHSMLSLGQLANHKRDSQPIQPMRIKFSIHFLENLMRIPGVGRHARTLAGADSRGAR